MKLFLFILLAWLISYEVRCWQYYLIEAERTDAYVISVHLQMMEHFKSKPPPTDERL